jgi:hypothetical protein
VKRLRRAAWFVAVGAAFILLPTWFYCGIVENDYVYRPRQPEPQAGWTAPYVVKGITVYVSDREAALAVWFFRLDIALFGVIFLCIVLNGGKLGRRPPNLE